MGEQKNKFYVTGGRRLDPSQNDTNVSPLVCYGRDRLDALANSGITVFTEEEWRDIEKAGWLKQHFPHLHQQTTDGAKPE